MTRGEGHNSWLDRFLRWRHARSALQGPLLLGALLVVYDGLAGPQVGSRNLAGVLPWIQWRGLTVLSLLFVGSLFCTACPFMLPRRLAKRLFPADRAWPRRLKSKLPAVALMVLFFWSYEAFRIWESPALTAGLVLAYFGAAFAVDGLFRGAAFCKYLCPIGQFNFVNSLASPLEIKARRPEVCARCATRDCIKGPEGCEMWLYQERKAGNMDCTFCLDCVHACPHDNVGLRPRMPGAELWSDPPRAGIGRFGRRPDLALLALVLVAAAFLNAFGMVGPFHRLEGWLAAGLGGSDRAALLVLFVVGLVGVPLVAVALAALATRALAEQHASPVAIATRYSFSLVPLGFGMWLAHYGFHFLTGALTAGPLLHGFLAAAGLPLGGTPAWGLGPLIPGVLVQPVQLLCLEAGLLGTLVVAYRTAGERNSNGRAARRALAPWALLALALFVAGVWLMLQPMEMRGMSRGG